MSTSLQSTVVVGAGAVGSFYGAMLARAGHRVTLVGRAPHVQAILDRGLQLHMAGRVEAVPIAATTDLSVVRSADLVLFCVKSTDTETVARQIAPLLTADALVLSLQNGVDNAATIARHVRQTVVPAVVYVATAMPEPGVVQHFGRGDLVIGPLQARAMAGAAPPAASGSAPAALRDSAPNAGHDSAPVPASTASHGSAPIPASTAAHDSALNLRLQDVVDLFATAGVPVRISPDVMAELWSKLMVNCAYNAISGLSQQPYGQMAALPAIREVQRAVVREVVAVAQADGQNLPLDAAMQAMERIATAMPAQRSSTAQDMARGKPSEIDHLNGFVVRRGAELGIATPVNQTLHALVKLVEAGRAVG